MSDDFAKYLEPTVAALGLTLNKRLSRKGDQRYGSNGSLSIDAEKGRWYDHEEKIGGGVLDLVAHAASVPKDECVTWMRDRGILEDSTRTHADEQSPNQRQVEEAVYEYTDETGAPLYQVVRYVFEFADGTPVIDPKTGKRKKTFRQRRRPTSDDDPSKIKGGWFWSVKGVRLVPYRLVELEEAIADDRLIFLVEGEKKADALLERGVPATCFAMGAGKWLPEYAKFFRGAHVVLMPDNDDVGRKFMSDIAVGLKSEAVSVRLLHLPDLPEKGDVIEWIAAGGTSERLYQLVETIAKPYEPESFVSKFGVVIWGEPRAVKEAYDYLIKPLIPRRESVLIYGASQSGKSFLTHDMSMAVARGGGEQGRYCGMKVRRGGVVYCAPEAGGGFADLRMPAYSLGKGVPLLGNPLPFACLTKKFDLFGDEKQLIDLIAEISQIKARFAAMGIKLEVVVIDTLNKVTPAMDEISGKDVGIVMGRLDRIKTELDTGLWLVHHKNAAGTGPRGHTSLYAAFETAIEVGRTGQIFPAPITDALGKPIIFSDGVGRNVAREERQTIVQKQREGEDGRKSKFYLRPLPIGRDDDGDERYSCVVEWIDKDQAPKNDGAKAAEEEKARAEERMTEQRRAIFRALKKAIAEYGVAPPPALNLPQSILRVVDKEYWAKVWAGQTMEQNPETARKALARGNLWLLNKGFIGRDNDWAWVTDKGTQKQSTASRDNVVLFPSGAPPTQPDDEPTPDWSDGSLGEPA